MSGRQTNQRGTRSTSQHIPLFLLPPLNLLALMLKKSNRTTRTGWCEHILKSQRALLNHHAHIFNWKEQPITLPNGHVVNMVIATSHTQHRNHQNNGDTSRLSDRVLMLLHGWGAGLAYYAKSLQYLVLSFQAVYLVDLPGMAASSRQRFPRHDREAGLNYFLDDLNGVHRRLCREDMIYARSRRYLGGHSLGAYIAAEWLIGSPPGLFRKLFLISPVGVPKRPSPDKSRRLPLRWAIMRALWAAGFTPQDGLRLLPSIIGRRYCNRYIRSRYSTPTPKITPAAPAEPTSSTGLLSNTSAIDAMTEEEQQMLAEYFYRISIAPAASERAINCILEPGAWAIIPLCDRLPLLKVPCTFLYGDRDWMDWKSGEEASRNILLPTRLVRVENADHNIFMDNAAGFTQALITAVNDFENGNF